MKKIIVTLMVTALIFSALPISAQMVAETPRGAAVGILLEFFGLSEAAAQTEYYDKFTDVTEDHEWTADILYAYEAGITKGTSDTEFEPFLSITAAEFITMFLRFATGDTSISPDTLLETSILRNPYYNEYVETLMGNELFTEEQLEETLFVFSGLADPGILLETYPTNIVQAGQLLYIPADEDVWDITIFDGSLVEYNGIRKTDTVYYMFEARGEGRVTIRLTHKTVIDDVNDYELYILDDGKGEGWTILYEDEVNTMLIGGIAEIELPCNPTTGYYWYMSPNDSIELIQDLYTPDPVDEGIVGSGGVQKLTFTAHEIGETEIVLRYTRTWEPETEDAWTIVVPVNVVESFG